MPCGYYDSSKDNIWDGIYCRKIGGRPGNAYWKCYCDGTPSDCPYCGGRDPYELHPDTKERNRVIRKISDLPSRITVRDGESIKDARYAYDRLHDKQQRWVDNYSSLIDAERAYRAALEKEGEQEREKYRQEQEREQENRRKSRESKSESETKERRRSGPSISLDLDVKKMPWTVTLYRVVLPIWAIWFTTLYEEGRVSVEIILMASFAVLQLLSMISGFLLPKVMKLRIGLWVLEGILAVILLAMMFLDKSGVVALQLGWVVLPYPVIVLGYKILVWLARILF